MSVRQWDATTSLNNGTADADINFAELQTGASYNDSARALMRAVKRWSDDFSGAIAAGGTANAITLTTGQTITTLEAGLMLAFRATANNSSTTTIQADSTAATAVVNTSGSVMSGGEIKSGGIYLICYNSNSSKWILLNPSTTSTASAIDITALTADATPDPAADYLMTYDASAAVNKKVLINNAIAVTVASQAQMETGTSTAVVVTPGRQKYHQSAAKAWGYVTYAAGVPTLQASYNVASITDTGTGKLTVTFTTAMSSALYAVVATPYVASLPGANSDKRFSNPTTLATGSFRIDTWDAQTSSNYADPDGIHFVVYGDQ